MLVFLWHNRQAIQLGILGTCIFVAFWRGAGPERWIAGIFVMMFVLDRLYHFQFGPGHIFLGADLGHMLIDGAATALFVWIALSANRVYPIWVAGFQLMATVSHIVRAISPAIAGYAYTVLMIFPSHLQTAAFGLGVCLHIRREIRHGPYRSWRVSSPPSQRGGRSKRRKRC
jgi:hypothetical protein